VLSSERAEQVTDPLARQALIITAVLAAAGSSLGLFAIYQRMVVGLEVQLVLCSIAFSYISLIILIFFRGVPLQWVATASTIFFAAYLIAGPVLAINGAEQQRIHVFIYLVWFFPLLSYNRLVNAPSVAQALAKILRAAPLLLVVCLGPRLIAVFSPDLLVVLLAYCMSYAALGTALGTITRYRERYLVERERAESLKAEGELLESISDCFISLDADLNLTYLNDAACSEFGVEREAALQRNIATAVPGFVSESMLADLHSAFGSSSAVGFEAPNAAGDAWYRLRCFPRAGGMSIFFRNNSASVSARRALEETQRRVREQAELLDRAKDAIVVQNLEDRIVYWNKGAERLYGWTAEEVTGRPVVEVFPDVRDDFEKIIGAVLQNGEWAGELSHRRRNGSSFFVESHFTLVSGDDGTPRSILVISTDVSNRKAAEERIEQLAFYDVLTELPNRSKLREQLAEALATATREGSTGALLLVDLDDFKTPNDTLGHEFGDLLLRQVAERLSGCVGKCGTVSRLGGDEFVVMLEGLNPDPEAATAQARAAGERIQGLFQRPYDLKNFDYSGSASIGIALFAGPSDTVDTLLSRADLAMHRAKEYGGNAMRFFDPAMQTFVVSRAALKSDLRRALQNREFELHYQPVVDLRGHVLGAEGLLRWRHPVRGMVPPIEFIPLAEEGGHIVELGRWVLETACTQLALWARRPGTAALTIAVNVSMREFIDPNFVNLVLEVLRKTGADPRRLRLEITESSAMVNVDDTVAKMTALKDHFVGFSIDDFGTGYSSLSHLKRLPLDILKIDRSFVNDVLTDGKAASIVRTIIALGQNLGLWVIAEGVETEDQRRFLEAAGCNSYQGYLFSPALTTQKFEAFVESAAPPPSRPTHLVEPALVLELE
jgi:diguanylate cyclase (GGDEF)-like protein/PAS domain S-box-containing protein